MSALLTCLSCALCFCFRGHENTTCVFTLAANASPMRDQAVDRAWGGVGVENVSSLMWLRIDR